MPRKKLPVPARAPRKKKPFVRRDPWVSLNRSVLPVPNNKACTLKLVYKTVQTTTTGAGRIYIRPNSLYDAFNTGTSATQPRGFDTLSQLYTEYRVHAVKIRVIVEAKHSTPVTSIAPVFIIGIHSYHSSTSYPTNVESIIEDARTKYKIMERRGQISRSFTMQ